MKKIITAVLILIIAASSYMLYTNYKNPDSQSKPASGESYYTPSVPGSLVMANLTIFTPDSTIFPPKTLVIEGGSSALSLLYLAASEANIVITSETSAEGVSITSIAGKYNGEINDTSAWTYKVNGQTPSVPIDSYILGDEDSVELEYVVSF